MRNRQDLKLKELEVEAKRLDALGRGADVGGENAFEIIHPLASFNTATVRSGELTAKKTTLASTDIPPVSPKLSEGDRKKLLNDRSQAITRAETWLASATPTLAGTEETAIKELENQHIIIMGDPTRFGTGDERRAWQSRFELQQAQARARDRNLKSLALNLEESAREVDDLMNRIASVK